MSAGNDREFIDHLQSKEGKEQAMKCPLLELGYYLKGPSLDTLDTECLQEECAWWDSEGEHCTIKSLFGELATLSETLGGIEHKMPPT